MRTFRKSLGNMAMESNSEKETKEEIADNSGGDWFEYERFLKEKNPEAIKSLNPAATDAEVREAEKALHVSLPLPYVKLLQIHNGQNDDVGPLFGRYSFLSLKQVVSAHNGYDGDSDDHTADGDEVNNDKGVVKKWWSNKWIPFAVAKNGDALVIDMGPDTSGRIGQVVSFYVADRKRELESVSFAAWLAKFIDNEIDEREEKPEKKEPPKEKTEPEAPVKEEPKKEPPVKKEESPAEQEPPKTDDAK